MILKGFAPLVSAAALAAFCLPHCQAQYLKISIPRHSELTPVQRLNREGVEEVSKQNYEKAEEIFYKAYLYDPSDPFTLNNLGYTSELQGDFDRAQRFYKLASEQGTNAYIDVSNEKDLKGKQMQYALDNLQDLPMRVNRMNFDAMTLLSQNRMAEAGALLVTALRLDPHNAFTLNNLGVASEATGDDDQALRYYAAAAAANSSQPAVVTMTGAWRGRPVSQMAAANQQRLEQRMQDLQTNPARSALLASRGVAAVNRNDWITARKDFVEAYRLDPYSAFSLNNAGYVAERDGDNETAQFFYAKAQQADDAHAAVGTATRHAAEGTPLATIADNNDDEAQQKLEQEREARRRQTGPIQLLHRDGTPVTPAKPAPAPDGSTPPAQPPAQPQQ
jgi:Flp pilus assembly protein TadD